MKSSVPPNGVFLLIRQVKDKEQTKSWPFKKHAGYNYFANYSRGKSRYNIMNQHKFIITNTHNGGFNFICKL